MRNSTPALSFLGTATLLVAASVVAAALAGDGASAQESDVTYDVTIENLTDGQPMTPPLIVAHTSDLDLWEMGEAASTEIQEIAENGNLDPAVTLVGASDEVYSSVVGDAPLLPGESVTLTLEAPAGAKLSWVSMLICTNDGFTGLDSVDLPDTGSETFDTNAYDAGTEMNTEDFADIVPPCQALVGVSSDDEGTGTTNPALAEGGTIGAHAGIQGGTDLTTEDHGWTDPVAMVTVTAQTSATPGSMPSTGGAATDGGASSWTWVIGLAGLALVLTSGAAIAVGRRRIS